MRIVITDLDGCLLDHITYDYTPALPALQLLQERAMPVVFCSSKTAAEVIQVRRETGNSHPFIVENGGGIYVPRTYFSRTRGKVQAQGDYFVVALGRSIASLTEELALLVKQQDLRIRTLEDRAPAEVVKETGLTLEQARRARQREFDVCFTILTPNYDLKQLRRAVSERGLTLSKGGRYFHLTADTNKGRAARLLLQWYRSEYKEAIQTVGVGDSQNDLDLLRVVDLPIVIPNPHADTPLIEKLPNLRRAPAPGPIGWNAVLLSLLNEAQ